MEPAKVVARFADGRVLKGYTRDFWPDGSRFHLDPAGARAPRPVEVALDELKAVFFVRDFAGDPGYRERKAFEPGRRYPGRKLAVVFADGEVLLGYTMSYEPGRRGFFLFPADPGGNNLRVFAVTRAVRQVLSPAELAGPAPEPRGGPPMMPPQLVAHLQEMVQVLRRTLSDWEAVVSSVQSLVREHEELRQRVAALEQDHLALQAEHARLRQERDDALRRSEALEATLEGLRTEHQAASRALTELRARCDTLVQERQAAAAELAAVLRRLQGAAA